MTNWVVNNIKFNCDKNKFEKILDYVKSVESDFDFNKIIPINNNKIKRIVNDYDLQANISYYINVIDNSLLNNKKLNKFKDIKYNKEKIEKNFEYESFVKLIKIAIENFLDTGYCSLCDARYHKWGTRWNASEIYIYKEKKEIILKTAWFFPIPIFKKLSKKFNIKIVVEYCGEDYYSDTGIAIFDNGISNIKKLKKEDKNFERIVKQSFGKNIIFIIIIKKKNYHKVLILFHKNLIQFIVLVLTF